MKVDSHRPYITPPDTTRIEETRAGQTNARPATPAGTTDRVSLSSDVTLANQAISAAEQADDVRPEEVARAKSLFDQGKIGTDLDSLASRIIDSLIKP